MGGTADATKKYKKLRDLMQVGFCRPGGFSSNVPNGGRDSQLAAEKCAPVMPDAPCFRPLPQTNLVTAAPDEPLAEVEARLRGIEGAPVVDAAGKARGAGAAGCCHCSCCWLPPQGLQGCPASPLTCATALPCPVQLVGVLSKKDFKKPGATVKARCS